MTIEAGVDRAESLELLESTHCFPCDYVIKAIGRVRDDFVGRIVYAARLSLKRPRDVTHTTRVTPNGEHVAVTLNLMVNTAEEVMTVYRALQGVEGLKFMI